MNETTRITKSKDLLPGDVVVDWSTHKPLQVVSVNEGPASDVPTVWESEDNHVYYDITADSEVVHVAFLPKGNRASVPDGPHPFPVERLQRVPVEHGTSDRRPQAILVRSMFAHALADLRKHDGDETADAFLSSVKRLFDPAFAEEVSELGDSIALD